MRRLVVIESPYAGDIVRNKMYLQRAIRHSISLGEAPIASHQMYTDALDDSDVHARELGIECGLAWYQIGITAVFYADYGFSDGMTKAWQYVQERGFLPIVRGIGRNEANI